MLIRSLNLRWLLLATSCLAIGAGASVISSAGASTAHAPAASHAAHAKHARHARRHVFGRAVHGDAVVHAKAGFVTVTFDRGAVQSVNGQQLTITEGTKKATYKTVTLTIPANARVRDNGHKATLASLQAGQRVVVLQGLKRTIVVAHKPKTA
ncbi:MAG: hypothetical protein ACR2OB_09810 [Solirubrobacteraceae bacterium]